MHPDLRYALLAVDIRLGFKTTQLSAEFELDLALCVRERANVEQRDVIHRTFARHD